MADSHTFRRFNCANLIGRGIFPASGCCGSCHEDWMEYGYDPLQVYLFCGCIIDYCCNRQARIAKLTNDEEKEQALMDKLHAPLVE